MTAKKPALAGASFSALSNETRQPEATEERAEDQAEAREPGTAAPGAAQVPEEDEPIPISAEAMAKAAGETEAQEPTDYYDSTAKQFLVKNAAGRWLPHDVGSYKRILKSRGLRGRVVEGETLAETDLAILDAQNHRDVVHHGPICGRNAGLIKENGIRILVTEDMRLPAPVEGSWKTLEAFLIGLFSKGEDPKVGDRQLHTFYGWMRSSVMALREGSEQQQQALAICGKADCGKSLLQHLITEMLAGRSAKASRYFNGMTQFNADLFAAEHLIIEDDHASIRISDRLKLGAALKEHCVGVTTASLHAKGRNAVNLRPWWRISITLNDDPEAMMILPPLDEHIADKIILLRASRFLFPMPVETGPEKAAFRRQLSSEIPAFLHFLLHEYIPPTVCVDPRRYNVATFHHPELLAALDALSPEADLLALIDKAFAGEFSRLERVEFTAEEIDGKIRERDPRAADRILTFRNACGTYLGRLAKKHRDRVEQHRSNHTRGWILHPPPRPGPSPACQDHEPF